MSYDDGGYGEASGGGSTKGDRIRDSLGDYNSIPERIAEFKEQYPDGRLRPADLSEPVKVRTIGDQTFLEYVALAYRDPEDRLPGVGVAWEKFPGTTPYTRNSEAMNAETSAWGRAIVAALIADAKKGIATQQEIRNRRAEQEQDRPDRTPVTDKLNDSIDLLFAASNKQEMAAAWKMAGSFWLHDTEIPGRDAGFLYRHLWKERMDQLNAEAQQSAGLGEETGEPQIAPGVNRWEIAYFPNGEADQVATLRNEVEWKKAHGIMVGPQSEGDGSIDDVLATGTDEAVAAVEETLGGEVIQSPEVSGE